MLKRILLTAGIVIVILIFAVCQVMFLNWLATFSPQTALIVIMLLLLVVMVCYVWSTTKGKR
jgi:hypothetical protein